ncbi:hypothetical protein EDD17DRAFT_1517339 [Pisolithus thermaeus]|nr:hypothetical protein EDD17DRAFT_1517339 [Pisolithus thermaeus]
MCLMLDCSVEKFASLFQESEGHGDASNCQSTDKAHSPLERHFKDVCQKANEIQGQPVGNRHVIAAQVECMQHMMKSVGKTLRDHEEKQADGIQTAQDKHMGLFLQALQAYIVSFKDIGIIWTALHNMQEAMESVKESLEQISGDGSSDMSQSWVHAQLSLAGELPHSACGFPITLSRVLDDGDMAVLEDLLQSTTGADGDASSSDNQRSSGCVNLAVNEEQKEILQTLEADEVLSQGRLVMFEQGSLDFVKHCMLTAMDVLDDKMMNKSCYLLMAQCQPPVPEPQMGHGNWNMSSQMSLIIS